MITGWAAHSMGLIADSLDMLADSLVYGLSLAAVGAVVAQRLIRGGYTGKSSNTLPNGEVIQNC